MSYVQYFIGALFAPKINVQDISQIVGEAFGGIESSSEIYPFEATRYYTPEMGEGLKRIFFSLKRLVPASELVRFKKDACQLEQAFFSKGGKRFVNFDPGYLDAVKVVLASTKQGGHKIALHSEIYADLVLDYFQGSFRSFDWTFPDFKSGIYFSFLEELRRSFLVKSR